MPCVVSATCLSYVHPQLRVRRDSINVRLKYSKFTWRHSKELLKHIIRLCLVRTSNFLWKKINGDFCFLMGWMTHVCINYDFRWITHFTHSCCMPIARSNVVWFYSRNCSWNNFCGNHMYTIYSYQAWFFMVLLIYMLYESLTSSSCRMSCFLSVCLIVVFIWVWPYNLLCCCQKQATYSYILSIVPVC